MTNLDDLIEVLSEHRLRGGVRIPSFGSQEEREFRLRSFGRQQEEKFGFTVEEIRHMLEFARSDQPLRFTEEYLTKTGQGLGKHVGRAVEPFLYLSESDDAVMLICERKECMEEVNPHRRVWWHRKLPYKTTPEDAAKIRDRHLLTHKRGALQEAPPRYEVAGYVEGTSEPLYRLVSEIREYWNTGPGSESPPFWRKK